MKTVLAEKGVTDFRQIPLDVLNGEPKSPDHFARHPFGEVPVLEHTTPPRLSGGTKG